MTTIFDELKWRGLINDCTFNHNSPPKIDSVYCGFDPTAKSLHVGNLIPLLTLKRFKDFGHRVIPLLGEATATIGDPSGKSKERNSLRMVDVMNNSAYIETQIKSIVNERCLSNLSWLEGVNILKFLNVVGRNFTLNEMISKESIKSRMEKGISFTEASYMLLQAYDFLHLSLNGSCNLQIGGSDQWGNMVAGIDLCKKNDIEVYALTVPLLINSNGTKFGKTEKGAIYLDRNLTSDYDFYQFWFNTSDVDVIHYLKLFTFRNQDEIDSLRLVTNGLPEQRYAQKVLAMDMLKLIRGIEIIPNKSISALNTEKLSSILLKAELATSLSDARRLMKSGGIKVDTYAVKIDTFLFPGTYIITKGKRDIVTVNVV